MTSTERFTEAIQLTHSSSTTLSNRERLNAEQYLMALRESTEGLNLSFYIITNEPVNDVRYFWAFNTVKHHMPFIASTVDDQQADELYRNLFSFIHRYLFASPSTTPADYVLNKHAQVMVVGMRHFFPNRWNTFFNDLFDLLEKGRAASPQVTQEAATIYFLRVFEYIDEQVVNVRDQVDRGREQRSLDMRFKDAMRESVVPRLVQTWLHVLNDCRYRATETANICLAVVQTYVEWVDVWLFMTPEWMNLLYFLTTAAPIRVAACECVLSLVTKKQQTGMKLASLAALNVVEALPRLLSLLTVPPRSDDELAFFDVVSRLAVSVGEQFLALLECCQTQWLAQGQQGQMAVSNSVANETAPGGVVQDRPYQLDLDLLEQLAASLHGSVNYVLSLLRVAPADSCDTLLSFFQLYSKSPFMNDSETLQLLLVTFEMSKIRDLARDEGRIWEDGVIDQRRTLYTLLRLLHRRAPALVFEYGYNLTERLVLVWSHTPRECSSTQPIHAVSASGGSRLACAGNTANTIAGTASTPTLSTSPSLQNMNTEATGAPNAAQVPNNNNNGNNGNNAAAESRAVGVLLYQVGSSLEDAQDFRDPAVAEAVLRFVYEVGESVKLEILRDEGDAFTQIIAQLINCEALVGAEQPNSGVHLTFFEFIDRYVAFFQYHNELIPLLLHRLLLLPGGVMNRNDRVRARIGYLFSHLLQVLRSSLCPFAADMVTALQSILASTEYLLPSDRRQLFEAIGTLLSITLARSPTASAATTTGSSSAPSASRALTTGQGAPSSELVQSDMEMLLGNAELLVQQQQQQQYVVSVMEGLVQPVIDSVVQLLLCCDRGDPSGGASNGLATTPSAPAGNAVADSIAYISAVAKGLGAVSPNNTSTSSSSGGGGGGNANLSSASSTVAGGASSLQTSFQGNQTPSAASAALSSSSEVQLRVAQVFTSVTEHVLRVLEHWHASAAVRDAASQFFQQMVNTVPYDFLEPYYERFVEQSLSWMEAVVELSRLLRLMYQAVNKAGARGIGSVARLTPRLWAVVAQIGTLDDAAPVIYLGVLSESAREKVDIYKQLFTFLFNVATWGSAPGLLLLPEACLGALVQQLRIALRLPTELELPRAALQTLTKLTQELCGVSEAVARAVSEPVGCSPTTGPAGGGGGGASSPSIAALLELVQGAAEPGSVQAQLRETEGLFCRFLLENILVSAMEALIDPSFNLRDAKNLSIAIGETGQLCKAMIARLGEAAMQVLYNILAPLVGADEAMGFCTTLRDQPKLNSALKIKFRDMLMRAQEQFARSRDGS